MRGNRRVPRRESRPSRRRSSQQQDEERFPRSRLLERATLGLGGVVALGVALPAAGFAVLPSLLGQRRRPVDLGPIDAFPEGQFVVATFLADPQAGEVSRRAAYVRNNGLLGNVPSFTIMSSRCTHVGCPTQPNGPLFLSSGRPSGRAGGEVGLVPTQAVRLRLPLPRQPVRQRRQPHGRAGAARARPLRVLDPQRPPLARPPVQRQPRRRHRRAGADPQLRAEGRRRARHRPRGVALPGRPAVMSIYELDIGWAASANERRYLRWELLACDEVRGVFLTDARGHARRALQRRSARLSRVGALARAADAMADNDNRRSTRMRRFSPRLFALGFALGAIGAAAVLAANVYALPRHRRACDSTATSAQTPDQVIQWNRILLGILRTPGAQPANGSPNAKHGDHARSRLRRRQRDRQDPRRLPHPPQSAATCLGRRRRPRSRGARRARPALPEPDLDARRRSRDVARVGTRRPAKDQGVRVGKTAAAQILTLRSNDGSAAAPIPFTPGTNPGDYQLTPPAFAQPVFTHWPFVTPFALRQRQPVQTRTAAGADERHLHRRVRRGQEPRRDRQHHPHRRPDPDREVLGRADPELLERDRPDGRAAARHHPAAERAPVRAARPHPGRLGDRLLRRQVHLPPLAARSPPSAPRTPTATRLPPADPNWTPLANTALDPSYPGAHAVVSAGGADVLASFFHSDRDSFAVTSEVLPGVDALVHELLGGSRRGQRQPHLRRPALPLRPGRRAAPRTPRRRLRPPELPDASRARLPLTRSPRPPLQLRAGAEIARPTERSNAMTMLRDVLESEPGYAVRTAGVFALILILGTRAAVAARLRNRCVR